jgi:hypothetical protein
MDSEVLRKKAGVGFGGGNKDMPGKNGFLGKTGEEDVGDLG